MDWILAPNRAPLWLLAAALAALATAALAEFVFDLAPCPFCYYQRWPYVALVLTAGFALLAPPAPLRWALAISAAALATGLGLALFHLGMEQGWWQGPATCSAPPGKAETLDDLRRQLLATPPVRCDEPAWTLFSISIAGFNVIASLALLVYTCVMFQRARERA